MNKEPSADSGYTSRKGLCAGLGIVALGLVLNTQDGEALKEIGNASIFIGGGFSLNNLVRIAKQS